MNYFFYYSDSPVGGHVRRWVENKRFVHDPQDFLDPQIKKNGPQSASWRISQIRQWADRLEFIDLQADP